MCWQKNTRAHPWVSAGLLLPVKAAARAIVDLNLPNPRGEHIEVIDVYFNMQCVHIIAEEPLN